MLYIKTPANRYREFSVFFSPKASYVRTTACFTLNESMCKWIQYCSSKRNCPWTMKVITPPPIGERSIVMSVCVRACVCLSVRGHIFGTTRPIFSKFLCTLAMAVARWTSDAVVIHHILPVLRMTSYLLISQGCSTSPPSWSAVHTQPWVWL